MFSYSKSKHRLEASGRMRQSHLYENLIKSMDPIALQHCSRSFFPILGKLVRSRERISRCRLFSLSLLLREGRGISINNAGFAISRQGGIYVVVLYCSTVCRQTRKRINKYFYRLGP